jgi:prophage regulatory protein
MNISIKPAVLDRAGAAQFLALSESTIQLLVRNGTFPKPRQLSKQRVGYLVRELEAWIESQPVSDFLPPANTGVRHAKQ